MVHEIEKRTNGQIKIKMYVAQALGKAAEHYNMVVTGRVEIAELQLVLLQGCFLSVKYCSCLSCGKDP